MAILPGTNSAVLAAALATAAPCLSAAVPLPAAAPAPSARVAPAPLDWVLGWNSRRDGNWDVHVRGFDGHDRKLTAGDANEWAWGVRGDAVLLLSNARAEGEPKGWRPHRMDRAGTRRLADAIVGDGLLDCTGDGKRCVAEVREGSGKRVAWFDAAGARVALLPNPTPDAQDADPQLSPDGRSLLFRSNRSGAGSCGWRRPTDPEHGCSPATRPTTRCPRMPTVARVPRDSLPTDGASPGCANRPTPAPMSG